MSTDDKPAGAASDEMKRKFKAALDKKNAQHHSGEARLNGESVVQDAHGPASQKREFRRKSGG